MKILPDSKLNIAEMIKHSLKALKILWEKLPMVIFSVTHNAFKKQNLTPNKM